ncbi:hypothetical protein DCAR_0310108 [Daucus carota subsp. sativus]|uniref:SMC hinge domain-containing protein n=2 Tax=Daucus carota subsp. sativus TaxID=79200 RepID=A0AAF0WJ72_DAUCS|nr:hypothetical protein DCAR_0310108 [Daucus carota subsp. sativus]
MKQLLPGNVIEDLELEVFDVYGNHVKQDTEMLLDMVGFCYQHKTKRIQVDNRGCIDLSGLLKVSTGYAETVSLSVLSNEKTVFSEESQTEKMMIRVATEIPEKCFTGSQLENVVFEIVKSDGVIDETVNDNEKGDMSHALIEGSFSFLAAHSRYPKLNELMDKILKYATYIGEHEKTIKMLNSQREAFEQALAKMQGKQRPSSKCKIRAAECWGEGNALKLAILRIIVVTTHDPDDQTTSTGKQRPSSKCKIRAAECWGEGNALKLAILQIIVVTTHDPDDQTTGTETDGGFYPTQSKTGLRHHHPYTIALKNFGSKNSEKERDVHVAIYKDGKKLSLQQMEKQYQEWILDMHNIYDEESDCGEDEPVIIINPSNRKQLGISSDGTSEEKGCLLIDNENGNPSIDIRESKSLPINIIDSGKCLFVESAEWSLQLEKLQHKIPSSIDILCARHCEKLEVEEFLLQQSPICNMMHSLPFDTPVFAGHAAPDEVNAVVRPASFNCALVSENLDQKHIAPTDLNTQSAKLRFSLETALHFLHIPKVIAKVLSKEIVLFQSEKLNPDISSKNSVLTVENLLVESHNLDFIRPSYEAKLILYSEDEPFCVIIPCQVIPGSIHHLIAKPKDFMKQLVPGNVIQDLELEVDNRGCIDLSGLLKDSTGYAETVSLSVLSNEKIVFSEKSQTDKRMIRVAIEIPEKCFAGSQLENVVFEIVKSNGVIDETINDNEKGDMSHALIEGSFSFLAAHSRYPKLNMTITVLVEKAPEMVYDSSQPQCTDEDHLFLEKSSNLETPKFQHDDRLIELVTSPESAKDIENIAGSLNNEQNELKDKILKYATYIGEHEKTIKMLNSQREAFEQDLAKMQASLDAISDGDSSYSPDKERMLKEIELSHTAASVVCKKSRNKRTCDFSKDIIVVVALLGNVETNELGRILAEFLGEEQMLGVVCKSLKAAYNLETCDVDGSVKGSTGLQALASGCGISLDCRYSVICLEDTRPYEGDYDSGDPQRMLLLPNTTLPNGNCPPGFIGYAVNMIYLDANQLYTRTCGGKGLRETLFYHLLGEVQVYKTRESMIKALEKSCIQHGAVSLDGGIIRGNGVISLGRREPSIHFPVASKSQYRRSAKTNNQRIQRLIDAKKSMLRTTVDKLDKKNEMYEQDMKKYQKYRDKYTKFLDQKGPLLRYFNEVASNSPS